jgi:hypothetical protein
MKSQIAPRLRALGFKGSGQNYELASTEFWAMVGFQKSAFSDAGRVSFTMNVLVVSRATWDAVRVQNDHVRPRPTANTSCGSVAWQRRIGGLLPGDRDLWWEVRAGANTSELADAVLWAVEDYALPAMRDQMIKA